MKEFSIEEKARRYDKAIERAEKWCNAPNVNKIPTFANRVIEEIFPELKESEDEKIRKELIRAFKSLNTIKVWNGIERTDILTWLEKQGEHKPDTNCLLSWSEIDEKMLQSLEGIVKDYWAKAEQEKNEIKIKEASNVSYFLKTIQKSPLCWIKCSDGLPNRDGNYLVVTDGRHNDVYDIARYDSIEGWHKASKIIYWMPIPQLNNKSIIEQKPADKVEPKKEATSELTPFEAELFSMMSDAWQGYLRGEDVNITKIVKEYSSELLERANEQKPTVWSEKDETIANALTKAANDNVLYGYVGKSKLLEWLKSLKDRVQPKQEWSEEDEYNVAFIVETLLGLDGDKEYLSKYKSMANWLKSLRLQNWTKEDKERYISCLQRLGTGNPEQPETINSKWFKEHVYSKPQWKPSDEQMTQLRKYCPDNRSLTSLYEQLKKLREE